MVGMKTLFSPIEAFESRAVVEWDTEQETFAYVDLGAQYKLNKRLSVGAGYLARDHELYDFDTSPVAQWDRAEQSVFYTGFFHEITDAWAWSMFVRYDTDVGALDEVGGYLQYSLDCLVFQLRSSYRSSFTRMDGTEKDNDFRISFIVWLRAMNQKQGNKWDRF
jgi:lipopolysaccharide assembly outer membrane protein LptD (OstA)